MGDVVAVAAGQLTASGLSWPSVITWRFEPARPRSTGERPAWIPLYGDEDLLSWSVGHRPDVAVAVARGLTATGTGVIPYVLCALAGIIAGRTLRRRAGTIAFCLVCLGAGQAARYGVMEFVARPRPSRAEWSTHASGWAFPSGHASTAALTAGLLVIAMYLRAPRGRTLLALVFGCWGALVGLTRVYLGVHWFSDVVGGWLGMCLCAATWWLPGGGSQVRRNIDQEPTEDHAPQDPSRTITPCVTSCCAAG